MPLSEVHILYFSALLTYLSRTNFAVKRPFLLYCRAAHLLNFLLGYRQIRVEEYDDFIDRTLAHYNVATRKGTENISFT